MEMNLHPDQMLFLLQWHQRAPLFSYLAKARELRLEHLLREMLWVATQESKLSPDPPSLPKKFAGSWQALNSLSRRRLLSAGMTHALASGFTPHRFSSFAEKILPLLWAERVLQEKGNFSPEQSCWTADASHYFPSSWRSQSLPNEFSFQSWHPEKPFVSPRLAGDLVVDFESPATRKDEPRSGVLSGEFHPYTSEEKKEIFAKLQNCLTFIQNVAPAAHDLIIHFTRTLRVRKKETRGYGSEQIPAEIGSIRLSNLHLDFLDEVLIAESLLHESIHNFLSTIEWLCSPFSQQEHQQVLARPISPWSDRPIPVASFTHAICVYYGLWNFLRMVLQNEKVGSVPNDQSHRAQHLRRRIFHCASGFLQGVPINHYLDIWSTTHPQMRTLFSKMQEEVEAVSLPSFSTSTLSVQELYRQEVG